MSRFNTPNNASTLALEGLLALASDPAQMAEKFKELTEREMALEERKHEVSQALVNAKVNLEHSERVLADAKAKAQDLVNKQQAIIDEMNTKIALAEKKYATCEQLEAIRQQRYELFKELLNDHYQMISDDKYEGKGLEYWQQQIRALH